MEIRVYYESLEQAEFYIKPIVEKSLKDNDIHTYKIKLIEKVQQSYKSNKTLSKKYAKKISEILIQKNPDVIISVVKNDIEIPLIIMEFSTAVFTKDHELQRTDNFNVALSSGAVYIKISPIYKNSGSHGGDTSYQYLEPYSLFYKKFNELSFHINWEVDKNNEAIVEKHSKYKSIPNDTSEISELIKIIFQTYTDNKDVENWKNGFNHKIKSNSIFGKWYKSIKNLILYEDIKSINTTRMYWTNENKIINRNNVFTLKLNRLGHAMDPERGMLNYYGTFFKNDKNVFIAKLLFDTSNQSWYKDTPKENTIRELIKDGFKNKSQLAEAMCLGLSLPNFSDLKKIIDNSKDILIDITKYINQNIFTFNTSFRNIIKNSDIIYITDGKDYDIYLTWNSNCYVEYSHYHCPNVTILTERDTLNEDDVTFSTIHHFFNENNIKTISVSYPGAQSDMPILPQPKRGRKQQRVYIDAIGIKDNVMFFQENKSLYSKSKLNTDIDKIIKFKNDDIYKTAIVEFKRKNSIETEILYIGIGFGETSKDIKRVNTELNLDDIDYFLVLSKNLNSWRVFSSINSDNNIFLKKRGVINKIETYKVKDNT
jgi:hypothetical protein